MAADIICKPTLEFFYYSVKLKRCQPIVQYGGREGGRTLMTWIPKAEHLANHIWDCDVYAAFAAELAGARTLADPGIMKKEKPKPLTERKQGFLDGLPKL